MGFLARRREEKAERELDRASEFQEWRQWMTGIADRMPHSGALTVEVIEDLQNLPVRPRPAGVDRDITYATCRHYTSEFAAELSRKYIRESEQARLAGDHDSMGMHLRRWKYTDAVSKRLAL